VLKPGAYLLAFGGTRTFHRMTVAIEDAGFEIRDCLCWLYGSGFPKSRNVGKEIDGWEGWGTALKPAWEPIILARKPLAAKTVASNVLQYGTGAINVDGCRLGNAGYTSGGKNRSVAFGMNGLTDEKQPRNDGSAGRWPANVILDETAAGLLDEMSGERPSRPAKYAVSGDGVGYHDNKGAVMPGFGGSARVGYVDNNTGASRFFYCAKSSRSERNAGLDGMPTQENVPDYKDKMAKWQKERGRNPDAYVPQQNHHPTVKPISLMRWLVRLITPPGGIVLDPFMGSGTTGIAAALEQMQFEGRDLNPEYVEIARQRIAHWTKILQPELL
jgi:site-specific DNA-methyltransferase (adenine-specific)